MPYTLTVNGRRATVDVPADTVWDGYNLIGAIWLHSSFVLA